MSVKRSTTVIFYEQVWEESRCGFFLFVSCTNRYKLSRKKKKTKKEEKKEQNQ